MSKFDLTTSVFYRWRYVIGYASIALVLVVILFVAGSLVPGEISGDENRSLLATSSLSLQEFWKTDLLNAPFYALQHLSLTVFGVTLLGIKLPALALGFVTAVAMFFLLRRWFPAGIAVLASMLVVTTGQFLFLAQNGAPGVLYLFWPTVILLFSTLVASRARWSGLWKVLLCVSVGLSLYTPLSIYVLIALASAVALHPHLRHILRRISRTHIAIGILGTLAVVAPLGYAILNNHHLGITLLGIPFETPNLLENTKTLAAQYFGFMSFGNQSILLPVFGLASTLLILYGLVRTVKTYATVQSYVILTWTILLLPVLVVNPAFVSIMFVPQLLLLASGLEGVLRRWYRLFPKNPYARVAGLIPLVILVGSMALFGLERYGYAYRYAPDIMKNFSKDILVIPDVQTVVVTQEELPLYQAVSHYKKSFQAATSVPSEGSFAMTSQAFDSSSTPSFIVASDRHDDGVRFYVFK